MIDVSPTNKQLILGTALWGWGVTRTEAYRILEAFLECGGMLVDTATNYPINKQKKDFGLTLGWLTDWVRSNHSSNLALITKIGSKNNMGSTEIDLSPAEIFATTKSLGDIFEENLSCVSIHWDNRIGEIHGYDAIKRTVEAMSTIRQSGLNIGLSGIQDPKNYYYSDPNLASEWIIQVKENFLTKSSRAMYEKFFSKARYLAYSINMGGAKLEITKNCSSANLRGIKINQLFLERVRIFLNSNHGIIPSPTNLNQLSLLNSYCNQALSGSIVGPRNLQQLEDTLSYWSELKKVNNLSTYTNILNEFIQVN